MPFLSHGWVVVILILVVVLIVLGPGKLPQVGGAVGAAIRDFRKASKDEQPAKVEAQASLPAGDGNRAD